MQYKDYFESDPEDLAEFEFLGTSELATLATIYRDFSRPVGELKFASRIDEFKWDDSKGSM